MKKLKPHSNHSSLITLLLFTFHFSFFPFHLTAQSPKSFSYQAVIRSADGELLREHKAGIRITIVQGSEDGRPVFIETHDVTTNRNGLATLAIGEGLKVEGSISEIEWADGPYWIRTETDPRGDEDYSITATARLLSVPYALYAARSGGGNTSGTVTPNTVVVDARGNGDYLTINAALKNISPTPREPYTILIMPGDYVENIQLIPHVTLQGDAAESVFIKGFHESATDGYVVKIEDAANVKLQSLTITSRDNNGGQPSGVYVNNSEVVFQNVHITGDWEFFANPLARGIVADNSRIEFDGGKVTNLEFDGIHLNQSEMKFQNSLVSAKNHGIEVGNGSSAVLANSILSDGTYSLHVGAGGVAQVQGSQVINSGIRNEGVLVMTGNRVLDSYSIGLNNSGTATVTGNFFNNCHVSAIFENGPGITTITANIIENTGSGGAAGLVVFNPLAVISNNVFRNNAFGDIGIASDVAGMAYISANVGTLTDTIRKGRMAGLDDMFIERNNNNLLFVLPEGGNLGMGTSEPTAPLHIVDGTANIRLGSNLDGIKTRLSFTDTSNQDTYIEKLDQGRLRFRVGGTNTRMTITQDGNVGIGTQNPTARLHTTGDVRLQGLAGEGPRMVVADEAGNLSTMKSIYRVGDFAHGGVVFYVEPCGTRGLVAAIEDQSAGVKWGGNFSTMAWGDQLYSGKMNTNIIISVHAAKNHFDQHAALVCATYTGGGFGDWYLPSKEELNLMYRNKQIIDSVALANKGSAFANALYWSSTENFEPEINREAWVQSFTNSNQNVGIKDEPWRVRAIRAF
jgi:hypothetical protein